MTDQQIEQENKKHYHLFRSKGFMIVVVVLIQLILLISVFNLGMKVAYHKARFTYSWVSNYPKNFVMPMTPGAHFLNRQPQDQEFFNANSIIGQIVSNNGSTLTVKGVDNNEKTVKITSATVVRKGLSDAKAQDLKPGDQIVCFGEANDQGQIDAKLIRVLNP